MRNHFLFSLIFLLCSPFISHSQNCPTTLALGQNIIQNGDFELGNVGFTTDASYTDFRFSPTDYSNPGWYYVGADPTFFNNAFLGADHTTGSGQFLMVDGSCDPNKVVWQQEVEVIPNTWYFFSTWLISIFNIAPAELQFFIDGVPLGNTFLAPPNQNWQEFTESWFSGNNNGTVIISVVNLTTNGCTNGNDFGMDDISFIPGCDYAVIPSPVPNLGPDQIVCTGDFPITLSSGIPMPHTGLSFNWNTGATTESIVINAPGTYSLCVSQAGACISSDIVEIMDGGSIAPNVSVFPTSGCSPLEVNIDNQTIGNALTYEWYLDGNLISTDPNLSNYSIVNTTSNPINQVLRLIVNSPCGSGDTSITLTINPGPMVDAGPDISVCTGGVNVNTGQGIGLLSWSSPVENISYWPPQGAWANPPAGPGSYPYILTAADAASGCIASDTLFISRANELSVEIIPGDTALCNSSSLSLSTNYPNANQYQWQGPGLSCQACANPVATPPTNMGNSIIYSVTVRDNNCQGTDSVVINLGNLPNINATDTMLCQTDTADIAVSVLSAGNFSYQWQALNGGIILGPDNAPAIRVASDQPGASGDLDRQFEVEVKDVSGCSSTTIVTVSFLVDCSSLNIRIDNDSICVGEIGMLTTIVSGGDGNYTYSWSGGNLQGATGVSIQDAPLASTQYKLVVTDGSGLIDSGFASIIVNNPPQAAFSTNTACVGQITAFQNQSSGAISYQWNFGNGNTSRDVDPQQKYSFPGDFWIRLIATDDFGCADSVVQQVVVNFVPDIDFVADSTGACPDLTTNFVNLSDSLDPGFIYVWDLGDGSTNSLPGNFSHTYTSPGLYDVSLSITTPEGCRDSLRKIGYVEIFPIPEANFYADPAVSNMLNPRIPFINTSTDATNFIWNFGDGNTSLEESPEHVYADTGTYQVFLEVQNDGGCRDTFSTEVMIQDFLTFYAPTAFTPNGDGNNDLFEPKGNFISSESFDLFIFNRWGNLIFESRGYPLSWDGTSKGKAVPMGTYVWRVVLRDQNNRPREYAGSVTVLR